MRCCRLDTANGQVLQEVHKKDALTLPMDTANRHSHKHQPIRKGRAPQDRVRARNRATMPSHTTVSSKKAVHIPVASTTQFDAPSLLNASRSPPQSRHCKVVLPVRPHNSMRRAAAREPLGFLCHRFTIFLWPQAVLRTSSRQASPAGAHFPASSFRRPPSATRRSQSCRRSGASADSATCCLPSSLRPFADTSQLPCQRSTSFADMASTLCAIGKGISILRKRLRTSGR